MTFATARSRPLSAGDIKPQPRLSTSTMPPVRRFAAKLAEATGIALSGLSGALWSVALDHIGEAASIPSEEAGSWFRLETRNGSMTLHLAFDRIAMSAFCEAAMGGTGTEAPFEFGDRPLSGIEKGLLRLALQLLESRTTAVFADHLATPVSQFAGLVELDDSGKNAERIVFHFLANVFGYSGELRLAASSSEIAAQFGFAIEDASAADAVDEQRAGLQRRIARTGITFNVLLGAETVLVEDLANLAPGSLLRLSSTTQAPVFVWSEGNPVFKASLARSGDRLAVRIVATAE